MFNRISGKSGRFWKWRPRAHFLLALILVLELFLTQMSFQRVLHLITSGIPCDFLDHGLTKGELSWQFLLNPKTGPRFRSWVVFAPTAGFSGVSLFQRPSGVAELWVAGFLDRSAKRAVDVFYVCRPWGDVFHFHVSTNFNNSVNGMLFCCIELFWSTIGFFWLVS